MLQKRLASWKKSHLSIGGRITLINSVLNSLPVYFLSFFKAPRKVIHTITSLQRNFLWGGSNEVRKTCWVSWNTVCLPKEQGGLGIKNIEVFNMSLLAKWKWRCLTDQGAVWYDFLSKKYGSLSRGILDGSPPPRHSSLWWKDLITFNPTLFHNSVAAKLGKGDMVSFWYDKWLGSTALYEVYPMLYHVAAAQDASVAESGFWDNGAWNWHWVWIRNLTAGEEEYLQDLKQLLAGIVPNVLEEDGWFWKLHPPKTFSVKSAYESWAVLDSGSSTNSNLLLALKQLWRTAVPSKVLVFVWRIFLDRLPTREALLKRHIIPESHNGCCAFCSQHIESVNHLFFTCQFSYNVWCSIYAWLGVAGAWHGEGIANFIHHGSLMQGKKIKRVRYLVWCAVVWALWLLRNKILFEGATAEHTTTIAHIKQLSWGWFAAREGRTLALQYSDWCVNSIECIEALKSNG